MPVQGLFALLVGVVCTTHYLFFSYHDEEKQHFFSLVFFSMEIKKVANLLVGVYPGNNRSSDILRAHEDKNPWKLWAILTLQISNYELQPENLSHF